MIAQIKSYAAHSPTGRLGPFEFDRRSPNSLNGKVVDWMEKVSDDQYRRQP